MAKMSFSHIHPFWHPALSSLCPKWAKAKWLGGGDDVGLQGGCSVFELVFHRAEKAKVESASALGARCSSCPASLKNLSHSLKLGRCGAGLLWAWHM